MAVGLGTNLLGLIGGSVLIGLGSLTSAGSSVTEMNMLHNRIKEAEKVLQNDRELSQHLCEWLSDTTHLTEALDRIRYVYVHMNLMNAAIIFQDAFKKNQCRSKLEEILKILKAFNCPPDLAEEISDIMGIFIASSMLYKRYRPMFDLAWIGFRCSKQLKRLFSLYDTSGSSSPPIGTYKQSRLTVVQKRKIAFRMALDVVNTLLFSIDLKSESGQVENVTQAVEILEKEAEIFENAYAKTKELDN